MIKLSLRGCFVSTLHLTAWDIVRRENMGFHFYTDDTQLYLSIDSLDGDDRVIDANKIGQMYLKVSFPKSFSTTFVAQIVVLLSWL